MAILTKTTTEFKRTSGICLLSGSILATLTMVLHPMGGDIEHIVKIKRVLMFSHAIAIFCLPFVGFGFWGLTNILKTKSKMSLLGFFILLFGLIAAMIAATINGLVLPNFASRYWINDSDVSVLNEIIGYGHAINISMTYIVITAISLSIGIWSFLIILTNQIPKWLGYFGLAIIAIGLLGVLLRFNFTDLLGFRTFIFGLVSWIMAVGFNMLRELRTNRNAST